MKLTCWVIGNVKNNNVDTVCTTCFLKKTFFGVRS